VEISTVYREDRKDIPIRIVYIGCNKDKFYIHGRDLIDDIGSSRGIILSAKML
jgi:hypothetical protein